MRRKLVSFVCSFPLSRCLCFSLEARATENCSLSPPCCFCCRCCCVSFIGASPARSREGRVIIDQLNADNREHQFLHASEVSERNQNTCCLVTCVHTSVQPCTPPPCQTWRETATRDGMSGETNNNLVVYHTPKSDTTNVRSNEQKARGSVSDAGNLCFMCGVRLFD